MYRTNRALHSFGRKKVSAHSLAVTDTFFRSFSSKEKDGQQGLFKSPGRVPPSNLAMSSRKNASSPSAVSKSFLNKATAESSYVKSGDSNKQKKRRFPMGSSRDQRFRSTESSVAAVTFLGTASCTPSLTRGVSSIAYRYNGDAMLFDCGEATQIQFQRAALKVSRIRRIFLTHNHGDHTFGLPGMLCFLGAATQEERGKTYREGEYVEPIDIYGPEGIRDMIRAVMQTSFSRITVPYRVHELKNIAYLHGKFSQPPRVYNINTSFVPRFGEREGGRDIYPDENGIYHLASDDVLTVKAAAIQHTVPCVGYVVEEKDPIPTLDVDKVASLVESNKDELQQIKARSGRGRPFAYKEFYAELKNLGQDEVFTFPDGTVVRGRDIHFPPRRGRKLVVLGDTCDASGIRSIAMDADILIHEATKAYVPFLTDNAMQTREAIQREAVFQGHSTPEMAAQFADSIRAKKLVLTHFSPRYHGDSAESSMRVMWYIEDLARASSKYLKGDDDVVAAWDTLSLEVPAPDVEK